MSRTEHIKELLGWLKVLSAILAAADISLIAWLAQNFRTSDAVMVALAAVSVALVTAALIGINRVAFRRIAELEDLP